METLLPKTVYYQTDDFIFAYDRLYNTVGLHCEVYTWKPSILRFGYSVFKTFLEDCKLNGVTRVVSVTPNPRFAKLFGGTTVKQLIVNGEEQEVIEWELD